MLSTQNCDYSILGCPW